MYPQNIKIKKTAIIFINVFLFFGLTAIAQAATYYVDNCNTTGNDTNNGTSASTPWLTINKVNISSFVAGDSISFRKGCTWREALTVPSSGSAGSPITFNAYGASGANPIINGEPAGLFTATAESGDTSEWTSITKAGTSNFSANATSLFHGSYGFDVLSDGTNYVYASKTIAGQTDLYLRYYLFIPASFSEAADYNYTYITEMKSGATSKAHVYLQQYPGGVYQIHGQLNFGSYSNFGTGSLAKGVWHRIDIHYVVSATVGGFQFWVDGVSQGSIFNQNSSGNIDTIQLGMLSNNSPSANSHLYFDDVKVANTSTVAANNAVILNNKSYITLQNLNVADAGDIGVYLYGGSSNNTIDSLTVHDIGNAVGYESGILINGGNNNTVSNNTVYNVFKGIQNSGYGSVASNNNTISNNTVYNINGEAISSADAGGTAPTGTIITGNKIYNCAETVDDRPGVMIAGNGAGHQVTKNLIYNCGTATTRGEGIEIDTASANALVSDNVIYGNTNGAIGLTGSGHTVYNNTTYNNNTQSYNAGEIQIWGSGANMTIKNNIFYASAGKSLLSSTASDITGHAIDYNEWYGGSATPFTWGGTSYNFANYKTNSSQDAHSLNSDPTLTNVSSNNFTLLSSSPAINAGVNLGSTYQLGLSSTSVWPSSIVTLNQNYFGSGWDMGAYVYPSVPALSSIASSTTSTTATITWTTDGQSDSQVDYGSSISYGTSSSSPTYVISHSITLTGLSPLTLYHFRVDSNNGTLTQSADNTFTTANVGAPTVSVSTPTAGVISKSVTLSSSASATSPATVSSVQYYLDNIALSSTISSSPYNYTWDSTYAPNASHTLLSVVLDNYGNYATSSPVTVTVDNLAPVITTNGGNATLYVGQTYSDLGATAFDARQGDLTSNITTVSHVNTSVAGTYTVTYDVSDDQGNAATEAVRTVVVQNAAGNGAPVGLMGQHRQNISNLLAPVIPIATSTTPVTSNQTITQNTVYNFTRNLSLHNTGADIKLLQQFLNTHGFVIATSGAGSPGNETNLFGSLTFKALQKFQKSIGLPATGFFGPMTRAYIANH